jgi:hypothetical protein
MPLSRSQLGVTRAIRPSTRASLVGSALILTLVAVALLGRPNTRSLGPARSGAGRATLAGAFSPGAAPAAVEASRRTRKQYGELPLTFVANAGQADPRARYYATGPGYGIYLAAGEAVFTYARREPSAAYRPAAFHKRPATKIALAMRFVGANPHARIEGRRPAPGKVNYLFGSDRSRWRTGLGTYLEASYRDLWPGIDLLFHGTNGRLKYDFVVHPGAKVEAIRIAYDGANELSLGGDGNLQIRTALGTLTDERPVSYQEIGGRRVPVASRFLLRHEAGQPVAGFEANDWDGRHSLVIDPGLAYSTFLGGSGTEESAVVAADADGNAYVSGETTSPDFPTTLGALDSTFNDPPGGSDAYVAKLNADGSALIYSTFLGGTKDDAVVGIKVDAQGNAYLAGTTQSTDFPTTAGAFDTSLDGPVDDWGGFVTKLNPAGNSLVYSTFLGDASGGPDSGFGAYTLALDAFGHIYLTGVTGSPAFPTTPGAYSTAYNGGVSDAYVAELRPSGSGPADLLYSSFLGGSGFDYGTSIVLAGNGSVCAVGSTNSSDFPTTPGAVDGTYDGPPGELYGDGYVVKLHPGGQGQADLLYSTFLGGTGKEIAGDVDVDPAGHLYVTGTTDSADFKTTPGAFDISYNGAGASPSDPNEGPRGDAFVAKLSPGGNGQADLIYSTFLGGLDGDLAVGIHVDLLGNAWVAGWASQGFPTTPDAFDTSYNGGADSDAGPVGDTFVTKLAAGGDSLLYSTFLGGGGIDRVLGLAGDTRGDLYLTGITESTDFPVTAGAFDKTYNGERDGFVTKIERACKVFFTPRAVSFGDVHQGLTKTAKVWIVNASPGRCSIDVQAVGQPFSVAPSGYMILAPGQVVPVVVTFHPPAVGSFDGRLAITTEDANAPVKSVPLHGQGIP